MQLLDYQMILDALPDTVVAVDSTDSIVFASRAVEQLLGFTPEELVGEPLSALLPQRLGGGLADRTRDLVGRPVRLRAARKDGAEVELELTLAGRDAAHDLRVVVLSEVVVSQLELAAERQAVRARGEALRADINAALAEVRDLSAMLERCAQALVRDLSATSAGFWLLDPGVDDVLVLRASAGAPTDLARARVLIGEGALGRLASTRQPRLADDAAAPFAGHPLVAAGRVVGVVALFADEPFPDRTLGALSSVADAIAQGIVRLRAVAAQQEGEARLRLALEATGLGAWEWDPRASVLHGTARALALLGVERRPRPTLAHLFEAVHPEDRAAVELAFSRALDPAGQGELSLEARTLAPARWVALRGRALLDEREDRRLLGTVLDVTEPRRAAADAGFLAEAGRQLARSLDYDVTLRRVARLAVPYLADYCLVDLLDEDGGAPRLVAAADRERSVEDAVHEYRSRHPFDPAAPRGLARVLRTGIPERTLVDAAWLDTASAGDAVRRDELHAMQLTSYMVLPLAVRGRSLGAISFVSTLDRSGRCYDAQDEALGEELARRVALAIDNARLLRESQDAIRARDEFLSIASHELRTPLTPLQLQVQSLRRMLARPEGTPKERLIAKVEVAERQIVRLGALVSNLLDISRITAGRLGLELEDLDLAGVVREVVERSREQLRRVGCELELQGEARLVGRWDRLRLEQVVTNLLLNAMKYGAGKPIQVEVAAEDDHARLIVRDQGIGIAPKDQRRIFLRFERAVSERHYGGFGLGLWISRQVVEAMGGTIGVQSALGRGATFTVRLPRR